jgi:hypothetical protein
MSLELANSLPTRSVAATGFARRPFLSIHSQQTVQHELTFNPEDFAAVIQYWLTNTDLEGPADPRLAVVEFCKGLQVQDGYNPGAKRLVENA